MPRSGALVPVTPESGYPVPVESSQSQIVVLKVKLQSPTAAKSLSTVVSTTQLPFSDRVDMSDSQPSMPLGHWGSVPAAFRLAQVLPT